MAIKTLYAEDLITEVKVVCFKDEHGAEITISKAKTNQSFYNVIKEWREIDLVQHQLLTYTQILVKYGNKVGQAISSL